MGEYADLDAVSQAVSVCRRCPRLVAWREEVGRVKRKAYADEDYWAAGVPGFGDPDATLVILGLAPAAHGANRTGRMFTGDRSGDFLYAALHRAGLANQPHAVSRDDGLELTGVWITAPVRCAPPKNKPTATERDNCSEYLAVELELLRPRAILCLGGIAWDAAWRFLGKPSPKPTFGHGAVSEVAGMPLIASYHVSQQNTFTGRLTAELELLRPRAVLCLGGIAWDAAWRFLGKPSPKPTFGHGAVTEVAGMPLVASYHVSQQNTFTGRLTEDMFDDVLSTAMAVADVSGSRT